MLNFLKKITNNPLLILGLVIIVIILLIQECMLSNAEGFNPGDPTNTTALATTLQLAQKFSKAMSIDNTGNVTFNKNVYSDGLKGRYLYVGPKKGTQRKAWMDPDGTIRNIGGVDLTPTGAIKGGHFYANGGGIVHASGIIGIGHKGGTVITPTHGHWGSWRGWQQCPANQYVCGGKGRFEGNQHGGDDTALNGFELRCCAFN